MIDLGVCRCVSSLHRMLGFGMVKRGAHNSPLISGWMSLEDSVQDQVDVSFN